MRVKLIGVDIGGTKCAVSLGETAGRGGVRLLERGPARATAGLAAREMLALLAEDAQRLCAGAGDAPAAVGISCGGPLDSRAGLILSPPNLPGWDAVPVTGFFEKRLGLPAFLCNDANAGALAEWRMGAGRGCENMIFMTFGTGLGAGLILNGKLYEGACDFAGETGHIRLAEHGPVGYGKIGSFEGFCSGGGIAQLAADLVRAEQQRGGRPALCPTPQDLPGLTAEKVGRAAKQGDALAKAILAESGRMLGRGLAILIDLLNPERIVIGSIFVRSRGELWPAAREVLEKEALPAALATCAVVPAGLTESVGDLAALTVAAYRLERQKEG
ncbi:ROK family protein [Anaerofilum sp. BX8]|uniref:ROK family protein n=1 Tax=Anaerofilum hominis TaxID=2763016 RepID=A0A923IAC2_9FIRM|nr:ROK family protein [Anaerofilum hominis]MBC5581817.1 ROK family protein [Anaerofilum hominis]